MPLMQNADDNSGHLHRKLIGFAGLLLPWLVVVVAALRQTALLDPGELKSISAYYYSGAVVIFVGTLAALSAFMLTYKGYRNEWYKADRRTALIAGVAAAVIALYPTTPPNEALKPLWWTPLDRNLHYIAAVTLFSSFVYYCLVLFRKTSPGGVRTPDKDLRDKFYVACGWGIIVCMAWAAWNGSRERSIFWPEAIALELFAISWLVKGRIDYNIRNPVQSVKDAVNAVKG